MKGNCHLDLVARVRNSARRIPDGVPRVVVALRDVVVDGIDLYTERSAEQLVGAAIQVQVHGASAHVARQLVVLRLALLPARGDRREPTGRSQIIERRGDDRI